MTPYDPNHPYGQQRPYGQGHQQQQPYPQQPYPQQSYSQHGYMPPPAPPRKAGSPALIVIGALMIVGSLPCAGYAAIRFSELTKIEDDIARDAKTLKKADPDSSEAQLARGSSSALRRHRSDKTDDVTLFGPLGGGLLVLGGVLAVVGGRKK